MAAATVGLGAMLMIPGGDAPARVASVSETPQRSTPSYLAVSPRIVAELDAALAPARETDVAVREARLPEPAGVSADAAAPAQQVPAGDEAADAAEETVDPTQVARVGDVAVNMRAGPSTTTGVIRPLQPGESLTLIETDGGWASVTTEDGQTGWVYASYLTGPGLSAAAPQRATTEHAAARPVAEPRKSEPEPPHGTRYARVGSDVYLRAGPSQTAERLLVLPAGERVAIAEIRGRWARVLLRSGASGWVRIR